MTDYIGENIINLNNKRQKKQIYTHICIKVILFLIDIVKIIASYVDKDINFSSTIK